MYIETRRKRSTICLGGNRTRIAGLLDGRSPSELAGSGIVQTFVDPLIFERTKIENIEQLANEKAADTCTHMLSLLYDRDYIISSTMLFNKDGFALP